jgi:hypothetical protein
MLSFYANTCLGLFKEAYHSCQELKAAVGDLMVIVGGTIHPHDDGMTTSRRGLRMEFWRVVNLFHVCTCAPRKRRTQRAPAAPHLTMRPHHTPSHRRASDTILHCPTSARHTHPLTRPYAAQQLRAR